DVWQGLEAHSPITLGSPCDASDWFSSDGSKMPRRSTRGSSPTWEACWAESLSEAAMGSLVKVRRVHALATSWSARGLPAISLLEALATRWASAGWELT